MSQPESESYTAAKGGIASLTHALAVSLSGKVRVNSISPGWIDNDYKVYEGQRDLMQAILNNSEFEFNNAETVRQKFFAGENEGKVYNYLNYRSFTLLLDRCDGTRDDFLDVIESESGLGVKDINMFKSILSTYKDKVTVGNSIFGNGTPSSTNVKSAIEAQNLLDDFIDKL